MIYIEFHSKDLSIPWTETNVGIVREARPLDLSIEIANDWVSVKLPEAEADKLADKLDTILRDIRHGRTG